MQRNGSGGRRNGNAHSRLGFQPARVKSAQFQFGKKNDVREKLSFRRKKQINDARDEIAKKAKFVDARVRIQNSKVGNKPLDARDRIKPKQTQQGNVTVSAPQSGRGEQKVMVTGLGRVHHVAGNIVVDTPPQGGHQVFANSNSIIVTTPNNLDHTVQSYSTDYQPRAKLPRVMIRNDMYQQPKPKPIAPRIAPPAAESKPSRLKPPPILPPRKAPAQTVRVTSLPPAPVSVPLKVSVPIKPAASQVSADKSPAMHLEDYYTMLSSTEPVESVPDIVSPLQGFRVMVTNLHPAVTQEDVVELFSDIGALKRARILKRGIAEVVFVRRQDAVMAVKRYHNRELDGMPMLLKLSGVAAKATNKSPAEPKVQESSVAKTSDVDLSVIHKALFKTMSNSDVPAKPVTFTIKI